MKETVDELVGAVMDIAREQPHGDATIIIADRLRRHITPYITALVTAKETIRALHGEPAWEIYDKCSPEMRVINEALRPEEVNVLA